MRPVGGAWPSTKMRPMKFTYLFGIILASNALGLLSTHRGLRTVTAAVSAACAIWGLAKLLG